jgi:hypothetical protein
MIDQNIIDKSTKTANQAIDCRCATVSPDIYTISNVFDSNLIVKLKKYLNQNQLVWQGELHKRQIITWDTDSVIEEIHEVCNNLTEKITQQFFNTHLNFLGIQIWKDQHPYYLDWHCDNPIINVALQVYMFDAPENCGTLFDINNDELLIPYVHNTGYIVVTKSSPGLRHKVNQITPVGVTRYSVYSIWSTTEKRK